MINFITGGTGFIGQRLMKSLKQKQCNLRVLSRKQQCEDTVICDLQKNDIPNDALIGVDTIFHLAGFAHDMRDTNRIGDLYQKVNVDATVRLAELAAQSKVKKFVFVSSVKV